MSGVYCGGLTIEPEQFEKKGMRFSHEFAGTVISGNLDATGFACRTLNKNWAMIKTEGKQKIHRFVRPYSYISTRLKDNLPMGALMRISKQNTHAKDMLESMAKYLVEMYIVGYEKEFLRGALRSFGKKPEWKTVADILRKVVDHREFPRKIIQKLD